MVLTKRQVAKQGTKLLGLMVDPVMRTKTALNKVKSICTFTKGKVRREALRINKKTRQEACYNKKGDFYVCGYTRRGKTVKPHCRKYPKRK